MSPEKKQQVILEINTIVTKALTDELLKTFTDADWEKVLVSDKYVIDIRIVKPKEYKKNWEVGTGFGVHRGDNYIPIEVQRNYSKNKAVSVEVHQDVRNVRETTGWEIKHKWLF